MIETVVFDIDDVLLPTPPIFGALARDHGIRANPFRRFLRSAYRDTLSGDQDLLERLPEFLERWSFEGTPAQFLDAWFTAGTGPDAQALAVVDALRNAEIRCAVASNQDRHRAAHLERQPWLRSRFEHRLYSHALGVAKPAPAFFDAVAQTLGVAPAGLLLLDDAPRNVTAARTAGWQAETCANVEALERAVRHHLPDLGAAPLAATLAH